MPSVKGNIVLNGINTITGIIFPIITFPYAARILLPEGIGVINFLNSIVSYIVLLTSIGIPMYAVKEVAKYRDDIEKRNRITIEIILLSVLLCLIGYIAVWFLATFVPQIQKQSALFYILSLTVLFTAIGVNWFYQGIEDFRYITIRAIIIRTLSAVSLFIFVKDSSDLIIYGLIIVGATVGNNIINFIHLRKFVNCKELKFKELSVFRHIKPALQVFVFNLITSLYIQLNSIMLGFMSGDDAVGYFSAGTKISHLGLTIITSLGTVLLPRCSHLIKSGDKEGFRAVINKSLNVTLALSLPMMAGLMVLAAPITFIFCGSEFMNSIPVLYLNAPVIVFISLTNVMGIQILYPMDKINIVIWSVSGGALSNLILNLILIPFYGATGAAISTLIAEFTVLVIQLIAGCKYYPFEIKRIFNLKYILGTLIMVVIVYLAIHAVNSYPIQLLLGATFGVVIYGLFLIISRDSLMVEIESMLSNIIHHAK